MRGFCAGIGHGTPIERPGKAWNALEDDSLFIGLVMATNSMQNSPNKNSLRAIAVRGGTIARYPPLPAMADERPASPPPPDGKIARYPTLPAMENGDLFLDAPYGSRQRAS